MSEREEWESGPPEDKSERLQGIRHLNEPFHKTEKLGDKLVDFLWNYKDRSGDDEEKITEAVYALEKHCDEETLRANLNWAHYEQAMKDYRIIETQLIEAKARWVDLKKMLDDGTTLLVAQNNKMNKLETEYNATKASINGLKLEVDRLTKIIDAYRNTTKLELVYENSDLQTRLGEAEKLVQKWRDSSSGKEFGPWSPYREECADELEKALRGET
jgi:chromosome segregation ATPase